MRIKPQTHGAIERIHEAVSHEFELYNYEYDASGGDNPYADGEFVVTSESPVTVLGRIENTTQDSESVGASGADIVTEKTLFVPRDTDVRIAGDADSKTKASEFVDTQLGAKYRAVSTQHQSDLLAVTVESI